MIQFSPYPIPVVTPLGGGYVVYVESNSTWENDCVTVALMDGGQWQQFNTSQIKSWHNATYDILKSKENTAQPKNDFVRPSGFDVAVPLVNNKETPTPHKHVYDNSEQQGWIKCKCGHSVMGEIKK